VLVAQPKERCEFAEGLGGNFVQALGDVCFNIHIDGNVDDADVN